MQSVIIVLPQTSSNPSFFVCVCVFLYQADVVVQQRQREEIFQSQLIQTGIRQTCQERTVHTVNPRNLAVKHALRRALSAPPLHHTAAETKGDLVGSETSFQTFGSVLNQLLQPEYSTKKGNDSSWVNAASLKWIIWIGRRSVSFGFLLECNLKHTRMVWERKST